MSDLNKEKRVNGYYIKCIHLKDKEMCKQDEFTFNCIFKCPINCARFVNKKTQKQ